MGEYPLLAKKGCRVVWSVVVCEFREPQKFVPLVLLVSDIVSEILQRLVDALCWPIRFGVMS